MGNKYRLGRKIGSGSFGDIYLGRLYYHFPLDSCQLSETKTIFFDAWNITCCCCCVFFFFGLRLTLKEIK